MVQRISNELAWKIAQSRFPDLHIADERGCAYTWLLPTRPKLRTPFGREAAV
jgi:hypothetical protein